jgi:Ca2+-binding EF-hand superfamily protein
MSRHFWLPCLLATLLMGGWAVPASAQFLDEEEGQGASDDNGAPADREGERGEFRGRGERGGRGEGERGRGGRGGRPNPLFESLDADGDGMINARELRQAVRVIKELDADGDGLISAEEFSPRGPGGPGGFGGRGGDPEEMIDRFMEGDINGDGKLGEDEVDERMARMLTGADTDGDGAYSRDEITQAMQTMRENFGRGGGGFGGGGGNFGGNGGGFGGGGGDADSMTRQVMSADQNGDGMISANEMNPQMARMLQGADTNGDNTLNAKEIRIYMETARQRMQQFRGQGGGRGGFDPRERAGRGNREPEQE